MMMGDGEAANEGKKWSGHVLMGMGREGVRRRWYGLI
jgi:hypothetical protein